jgi:hypothetical protein
VFLFGRDADVAQDRAGELGEEAIDKVEPGSVLKVKVNSSGKQVLGYGNFHETGRLGAVRRR